MRTKMLYETFDTTPNAYKLFHELITSFGYDTMEALSDILDNAIDATALLIKLMIRQGPGSVKQGGGRVEAFAVVDNGCGMSAETLQESFKFCNHVKHGAGEIGKFGFGGTAASFALAHTKTVYSKEANGLLRVAYLDVNHYTPSDGFENAGRFRIGDDEDIKYFKTLQGVSEEDYASFSGTIVTLQNIRNLDQAHAWRCRDAAEKHFGEIYHKFIDGGVKIETCLIKSNGNRDDRSVEANDPLLHDTPELLAWQHSETINYKEHLIGVRYSILNGEASRGNLITDQGIYVTRNQRQIVRASSLGNLWTKAGAAWRSGRMEFDFPESLDVEVGLTASKNKVVLSAELKEFLKTYTSKFRAKVHQMAQTPSETKEELLKEEGDFADKVNQNAAPLRLPQIEQPPGTSQPNPDAGRGPDKKKRKKRDSENKNFKNGHSQFRFEHVKPNIPTQAPYWFQVDDEFNITVSINDDHTFITENYINAAELTKKVMRHMMAAQALTQFRFQDDNRVTAYVNDFYVQLSALHNLV